MSAAAVKKTKATEAFTPQVLAELRHEMDLARREVGGDRGAARRLAFVELGLRWTELEARAHALLAEPAKVDRKAAKELLDQRFALMREVFQKTPLAVNVAYISWGEDALWARVGWERPKAAGK